MGRAVVDALLAEGARVATCARDEAGLRSAYAGRDELTDGRLHLDVVDVRSEPVAASAVAAAADRFGRLDGVVANAGAGDTGRVLDAPAEQWLAQFDIKVIAALNTLRPAVPYLRESDAGRVVVMNGITAREPEGDMAPVSAARAALLNVTMALAVELAPNGVCVNAVNLGAIVTDRQRARHAALAPDQGFDDWCAAEALRRDVLLGRLGTPADVAPAVVFLLSPLAGYLTGTAVDVAGGAGRLG